MKFLEKSTKNNERLQRFIGLDLSKFDLLVKRIEPLWEEAEHKRLHRENRRRDIGGGHPYKLKTIKEKLFVILMYYKQYLTQEMLGYMLCIDQSNVSRLIAKLRPIIEAAADPELKDYLLVAQKECKRFSSLEELQQEFPDFERVSTDATEQDIMRSQQYDVQEKHYSGKAKRHTIKTQITASVTGKILDVSGSYPGSEHDKKVIDAEQTITKIDERIPHHLDSGYQGVKTDYPNHNLTIPIKKPKGGELSDIEKEFNKRNSQRRIIVEHCLAKLKQFRILATVYRQKLHTYNQVFRSIAAIINFKRRNPVTA